MLSGNVHWCTRCGYYADRVVRGLARSCKQTLSGSGRRCNAFLEAGYHPRSGLWVGLPRSVRAPRGGARPTDLAPGASGLQGSEPQLETVVPDRMVLSKRGRYVALLAAAGGDPSMVPVAPAEFTGAERMVALRRRVRGKQGPPP